MPSGQTTLGRSIFLPLIFVLIIWVLYYLDQVFQLNLYILGIFPRSPFGFFPGILTAPLIHGNYLHLLSNTFPFIFLATTLFLFYPRIAPSVMIQCYLFPGILVWIFGRVTWHFGASGLIYGIAIFLIFIGIFRKDFKSIIISIVILILYGSLFSGLIPFGGQENVSYESHIAGALVGFGNAWWRRR